MIASITSSLSPSLNSCSMYLRPEKVLSTLACVTGRARAMFAMDLKFESGCLFHQSKMLVFFCKRL